MIVKIIGILWVIMALGLMINPEAFMKWMQNNRKSKYMLFIPFLFGIFFIYIGMSYQGVAGIILTVLGAMGILKGIIFVNRKMYNATMDWALRMPVIFFRIGACIHLAIGIMIIMLS
ncbi:MAG: hypothetical protein ABH869_04815 [Candidatus Omnitrophota bacterium]